MPSLERRATSALLIHELRHGLRAVLRDRAYFATSVLLLALGVGVNGATLSCLHELLWRSPAHVQAPNRLFRLQISSDEPDPALPLPEKTSYPSFSGLRASERVIEGTAANLLADLPFGSGLGAAKVRAALVTPSFFHLLGVRAEAGRFFARDELGIDTPAEVVVLSEELWRRRFAADAEILGREVRIAGRPRKVIGIAPRGFRGVSIAPVDVWLPLGDVALLIGPGWQDFRSASLLDVLVRVQPGVSVETATAALTSSLRGQDEASTGTLSRRAHLGPAVRVAGPNGAAGVEVAQIVTLASLAVLLIAVIDVGNLALARSMRKRSESALRLALGSSRLSLARRDLVEGLWLGTIASVAALGLGAATHRILWSLLLPGISRPPGFFNPRIFLMVVILGTSAGIASGVMPILGRRVSLAHVAGGLPSTSPAAPCSTVVGVVEDVKSIDVLTDAPLQIYVRIEDAPPSISSPRALIVRTRGTPMRLEAAVRRELYALDNDLVYAEVTPISDLIAPHLRQWRLGATLLSSFGALALILALCGTYGLVAFFVAQSSHDLGVRLALGADFSQVISGLVRRILPLALIGLGLGLGLALFLGRVSRAYLYGVESSDPALLVTAVATLLGATLLASYLPALRVRTIDPAEVLRAE